MKKRVLSLILCGVMLLTAVPLSPLADIFTIEAFAGDISELQKVYDTVPDKDDWDLYIDTRLLESYYNQAKNIITWNSIRNYSQEEIDEVTEGLRGAVAALKFHTQSISISSKNLNIEIGKTATLKVTLNPENAGDEVKWSSNNSSYVSVEKISNLEAQITVHKYIKSNVTITATSNGKVATCTVTVLNPLSAVKLSTSTLTLFEDQSENLIATAVGTDTGASPTGDVFYTWTTSKSSVASVTDDGEVFAVSPGTATITVTATDGKGTSVKATCKVTVSETVHITALSPTSTLVGENFNMVLGESETFKLAITPTNASFKTIDWSSSKPEIATVSDAKVSGSTASITIKALKEGKTRVTYKATDGSGVTGSFVVVVKPLIKTLELSPSVKVISLTTTDASFKVVVTPEDAGNQVLSWVSSDESICTVDKNGKLYPKAKGVCTITGTTTDGTNISYNATLRVASQATTVSVNKEEATLTSGKTLTLKATVTTADGEKYNDVEWTSGDTNIATVDKNGVVTAKYPGKVVIKATALDGTYQGATCVVTVIQGATGVEIPEAETVSIGESVTLKANVIPEYASNKDVTWSSSDESIAFVDENGVVIGKKEGTAIITCTTVDGGFTDECKVSVVISAQGITLNRTSVKVEAGYNYQLTATVTPESTTNKGVIWSSSDETVAKVNSNGLVSVLAGGTCVITATTVSGGISAKCTFTVLQNPSGIEVDSNVRNMYIGQVATLTATVLPLTATSRDVTWTSSNTNIATVTSKGLVTALSRGTAIITAKTKVGGYTATCAVTVGDKVAVSGLTIDSSSLNMIKGDTYTILATVEPSNASEKTINWSSSDSGIATVNDSGVVTAIGTGETVITAITRDGSYQKQCKVSVTQPVTGISLALESVKLAKGKSKTLKANIEPADASNKKLIWESSDESVATVTSSGVVRAKGAGNATILVTTVDGGYSASCNISVYTAVSGVTISAETVEIPKGEKRILTATIEPADAQNQELTWTSSNTDVARIDAITGQVTGRTVGTAKITVTTADGGYSDSCIVEVVQLATGVSLSFSSVSLDAGKTKTISASVTPSSATYKTVTWSSSNEKVAKVSASGKVTAVSAGTATITATSKDGAASATCRITVKQPASSVVLKSTSGTDLSTTTMKIAVGSKKTIVATIKPDSVTNKDVTWSSADKSIATVSSSGVVKGVKAGKVKITATSGDGAASKTITVRIYTPVTSVSLNKTSLTLKEGGSATVTPTIKPSGATYKTVTWTSSNYDVATVDKNGKITAKGVGYAVITATTTQGSKKATCNVSVVKPVTGVSISESSLRIEVGDKVKLKATVKPSDASNQTVSWKSSASSIAKVSSSGTVTANKLGTATITVTTADGSFKKTCKVEVVKKVTGVELSKSSATLYLGKTLTLKATVSPSGATNSAVTFSSSDTAIAKVSSTGIVTPVKPGTATITVKTSDGGFTDTCKVTVKRAVTSIALNKTTAELKSDTTLTLKATIKPSNATDKTVTWTTSNKKVATVSSKGVVTPVGKGTATITAKSENGLKATCKVTVYQVVTGVKLSETSSVYAGEKVTLKATVQPTDANTQSITWSSSNTAVAKVSDKGVVTGVKAGTAEITVKTKEGGFTAKCTVTVKQHVTSIALNKTDITVARGSDSQLTATIKPANATDKTYTFTSSNEKVATVTEQGLIKAVACGEAVITVKSNENKKTATCKVTVVEPVKDMELGVSEITLYKGKSQSVEFKILPEDATIKTATFSTSDAKIANVNKKGVVTAVDKGEAIITVIADGNKNIIKTVKVTVLLGVEKITAEKKEYSLYEKETAKINVTVLPEGAENPAVTYKSADEKIATVDANGNVKGISKGETVVTVQSVQAPKVVLEIPVKVKRAVASVSLSAKEMTIYSGAGFQLTATPAPADADNLEIIWSTSDETIARVNAKGGVTGVKGGEAVITATSADSGKTAQCKVTVRQSPEKVTLSNESKTLNVNTSFSLSATVLPENTFNKTVTWKSSDESVATVDKNGKVTSHKVGECKIIATASDSKTVAECIVRVFVLAEKVEMGSTLLTMQKDQSLTLKATVLPETASEKDVTWSSSDEKIVSVDKNGKITTHKAGTAVIRATSTTDGVYGECTVHVKVKSTEITLSKKEAVLYLGEPLTLKETVLPEDNTNDSIIWTSDKPEVASVKDGVVTAHTQGKAVITAKTKDSGVTATCTVTVKKHTEGIKVSSTTETLYVGKSVKLTAEVSPADATNRNVVWTSSDSVVATVKNGNITALRSGIAVITAKTEEGEFYGICVVKVIQGIEKLSLDKGEVVIDKKESVALKAQISPLDADDKAIVWTSTDESVAKVIDGVVTGQDKSGTAIIRVASANDGKVYAECTVKVKEPVGSIELSETEVTLKKGDKKTLTANILPENAYDKTVIWTSGDDKIATVKDGVVTAVGAGTVEITVTSVASGVSAKCRISVE